MEFPNYACCGVGRTLLIPSQSGHLLVPIRLLLGRKYRIVPDDLVRQIVRKRRLRLLHLDRVGDWLRQ